MSKQSNNSRRQIIVEPIAICKIVCPLHLLSLRLLLLLNLEQQGAVDVWKDTSKGDGGTNQGVELFVTTDGKLQVARCDTLDLEVLGGVLQREKIMSTLGAPI